MSIYWLSDKPMAHKVSEPSDLLPALLVGIALGIFLAGFLA